MKMTYIRSNRKGRSRRVVYRVGALICLAGIAVLMRWVAPDATNSVVGFMARPFTSAGYVVGDTVSSWQSYFVSKRALQEENKELRTTLDRHSIAMMTVDALRAENRRLAQDVGLTLPDGVRNVPSRILLKPPSTPFDSLQIDVGTSAGVEVGDPVYAVGNVFLGRIETVARTTSMVRLASSPETQTQAVLFPPDIYLTISGQGGGTFEAQLPADVDVSIGDRILTRGRTPDVIGIVRHIDEEVSDSFQRIRAVSPVNIVRLGWVSVHTGADDGIDFSDTTDTDEDNETPN